MELSQLGFAVFFGDFASLVVGFFEDFVGEPDGMCNVESRSVLAGTVAVRCWWRVVLVWWHVGGFGTFERWLLCTTDDMGDEGDVGLQFKRLPRWPVPLDGCSIREAPAFAGMTVMLRRLGCTTDCGWTNLRYRCHPRCRRD